MRGRMIYSLKRPPKLVWIADLPSEMLENEAYCQYTGKLADECPCRPCRIHWRGEKE